MGDKTQVLLLDRVARRYGVRPSVLLGVYEPPMAALAVDMATATIAAEWEVENRVGEWWWVRIFEWLGGYHKEQEEVAWL